MKKTFEPDPGGEGPESTPGERASETFVSDHWAEHRVLAVENGTPILTSLHSDALQSPVFLDKLIESLGKPNGQRVDPRPFKVMRSKKTKLNTSTAFFTRPSENRQDGIIFAVAIPSKVHDSDKHDNEGIVDAAYDENMEQPLIHRFKKYSEKIKDLIKQTRSPGTNPEKR